MTGVKTFRLAAFAAGLLIALPAAAQDRKQDAFKIIDRNADTMAQIGDAIYSYAALIIHIGDNVTTELRDWTG